MGSEMLEGARKNASCWAKLKLMLKGMSGVAYTARWSAWCVNWRATRCSSRKKPVWYLYSPFIPSLDKLTGTANRVLFDNNKLESALHESGAREAAFAVVLMNGVGFVMWTTKQIADGFIIEVGEVLSNIVQRYPMLSFLVITILILPYLFHQGLRYWYFLPLSV